MKRVEIKTARPYSVLIGGGVVRTLPLELHRLTNARRVMVVTDETIASLHLPGVLEQLKDWEVYTHMFPAGECHKTMDSMLPLLQNLLEAGFDRSDVIVALGGGVVGDMAGFAASMYMRGIDYVNIPTTLLSQVDSSVGGKTGVDLMGAKNILGAFYQPRLVICDTDYLTTLPQNVFADGCAEVIKYAFIGDEALLPLLDAGIQNHLAEVVCRCVQHKAEIVASDEFDRGRRGLLNFGHTIGHAVEKASGYAVSHGAAVAVGMFQITAACEKAGLCGNGVRERLQSLLQSYGLPLTTDVSLGEILAAVVSDKKKSGDSLTAILPRGLGSCEMCKLSLAQLEALLDRVF